MTMQLPVLLSVYYLLHSHQRDQKNSKQVTNKYKNLTEMISEPPHSSFVRLDVTPVALLCLWSCSSVVSILFFLLSDYRITSLVPGVFLPPEASIWSSLEVSGRKSRNFRVTAAAPCSAPKSKESLGAAFTPKLQTGAQLCSSDTLPALELYFPAV